MTNLLRNVMLLSAFLALFFACSDSESFRNPETQNEIAPTTEKEETYSKPRVPDWHKNAVIYEVNLRHYTPEGTFAAFEKHILRLKTMGIDILWFMPIHPISKTKRKGGLGSPYAVGDYKDVNPDHGNMDDFKKMLKAIHDAGMYAIIDWVPNHTGWDNPWITEHPDWYTKDSLGNIIDPIDYNTGKSWGWTDVADLNYDNPEMRLGMIDAMTFWIKEVGIDGFRVDVAHGVPVDFWAQCSDSLYAIEPLFMLAEAEVPAIVNNGAYVMDYGWEMHHLLNDIAKTQKANRDAGKKLVKGNVADGEEEIAPKTALDIDRMLAKKDSTYTKGYQMQFTSNHDENAWSGTEFQRFGDGHLAFAVLTGTFDGMPLIYTGQESAVDNQYAFFEKDEIDWGNFEYAQFYQTLNELKHRNKALWNGSHGGKLVKIKTGQDESVYAFTREKGGDKVAVIINLSSQLQEINLNGANVAGEYLDVFASQNKTLTDGMKMKLDPWQYYVLSSN